MAEGRTVLALRPFVLRLQLRFFFWLFLGLLSWKRTALKGNLNLLVRIEDVLVFDCFNVLKLQGKFLFWHQTLQQNVAYNVHIKTEGVSSWVLEWVKLSANPILRSHRISDPTSEYLCEHSVLWAIQ